MNNPAASAENGRWLAAFQRRTGTAEYGSSPSPYGGRG